MRNTITAINEATLTPGLSTAKLKLIRWLTIILATVAFAGQLQYVWEFYTVRLPANDYSILRIVGFHVQTLTWLSLAVMAILISIRSKSVSAYYLAIFLACFCAVTEFSRFPGILWIDVLIMLASIATGVLFILSMQYFPISVTKVKVASALRVRFLRWYLAALLRPRNLWTYFVAVLLIFALLEFVVEGISNVANFLILLTGFGYLFINYRLTSGVANARILWLFWGLAMYILASAIETVVFMYSPPGEAAHLIVYMLTTLILLFSFVMSFFFADAFDTGIFVRKTAVNAILFLLVVFAYNTLEHYVLHWISHTLHLSNAITASLASGFIVLCISPLHHRLTHFLTKKLKGHTASHH